MNYTIRLTEETEQDLYEAAVWYEDQQNGLGHEFLATALSLFQSLENNPLRFQIQYRGIRRALMERFPFGVFFRINESTITVLAVMHASRHPQSWRKRV